MKTALKQSLDQLHSVIVKLPSGTPYRVEFNEDEEVEIEIVANTPYDYRLLVAELGVREQEQMVGLIAVSLWKGYDE